MSARRRGPAVALLFVVADFAWSSPLPFVLYQILFGELPRDKPTAWQYPLFALATGGTLVLAMWLFAVPEGDPAAEPGSASLTARP